MATPVNVTYSVASGLPIYGGRSSSPTNVTLTLVGDSLTDSNFGALQTGTWMNAVAGGKLQYVFNCGVSGNTVGNVISRIDNAYDNADSSLRGLAGFPVDIGYIIVRIGTNDARATTPIAGTLTTQYATLMAKLAGYAEKVIVLSVPPLESTGGLNALTIQYNAHLAATYNSGQFMYVADDTDLRDGSGAQITSFFDTDKIHYLPCGVSRSGRTGGADAAFVALMSGYASPVITDAAHVYPAYNQWIDHPAMNGTGGSVPSGFTGTVTTGYAITHSGTLTGVLSIVASTDSNPCPWQDIEITAAGASGWLSITPATTGRSVTTTVPSWMEQIIEYGLVGFDTTHVSNISTAARIGSDYAAPTLLLQTLNSGTLTLDAVARQKLMRIGASSGSLADGITIQFDSTGVGSSIGHIRYRCPTLEG